MGAEAPPSPADVASDAADDVGEDGESPAEGESHAPGEENGAGRGLAFAGDDMGAGATAGEDDEVAAARMFGTAPAMDEDAVAPGEGPAAGLDDAALARSPSEIVEAPADSAPGDEADQVALPTLEGLLLDAGVTAIIIAPTGTVQVERTGLWESIATLGDGTSLAERVWQLANTAVPPPPSDNPVVDVRLPDGTRVTALFPPITPLSVCAAIRKSTVPELSLAEVSGHGDVERILTAALASRRNILLAGDRPALGALAGAMAGAIPAESQVLSIGAGTRYRPGWIELAPGGEPSALIRAASAFRADHLLVADPEGGDLPDLLLAAARGQGGIVAAVSARSASEALTRLRAFSVGVVGAEAFVPLVASTIDLVVFAAMDRGGRVRVVEVVEPVGHGAELTASVVARRGNLGHSEPAWDLRGVSSRLGEAIAVASDALPAHLVRPH
jgi:pilus assembly protein CpaF